MTLILFLKHVCVSVYTSLRKNWEEALRWCDYGCLALFFPLKHLYFPNLIQQHSYFYNQKNILKTALQCSL